MVRKSAPVTVRKLTPTEEVDESPQLLYRPIPQQLTLKTIPFTFEPVLVTPEEAQKLIEAADQNDEFAQRPRTPARRRRWLTLMQTKRFVHFSPDGPICTNDKGLLMNGGNRLGAVAEHDEPVGFIFARNVPTWMVQYFDTGDKRSQREHRIMMKRNVDPQHTALARLGMRYEEFLFGKRSNLGWVMWGRHRDEYTDIDNWLDRREYVTDWIPTGKKLQKTAQLMNVSGAAFAAYQNLAWPEGADKIQEYLDGLILGAMLKKGNPALTLREWAKRDGYIGEASAGRREGHLLLLFKMFDAFVRKSTVADILVAKGFPMSMPYHPKGYEVAVNNVREALAKMDAEVGA